MLGSLKLTLAIFILRRNLRLDVNYISKTVGQCKICQAKIKASQLRFFVSIIGKTEDS